jgi:putative transposase
MNRRPTVGRLCRRAGMSRQNYYAQRHQREERQIDTELVERLVRRERRRQGRLGSRKVFKRIRPELREAGVKLGRDRYFTVLRKLDLLVKPKPRRPKTTQSRHSLPVFTNLVKGKELTGPNQAWASDLTYVCTDHGFMFAALITDMYSRKIVGHAVSDDLGTEGCLKALEMALKELPAGAHPIHHSDRGCQYCSHLYVERLQKAGMDISMTQELHCYENALAERVNGILKQEYELDGTFRTKGQARKAFEQAVWLYNYRRPHMSLKYRYPAEVHRQVA